MSLREFVIAAEDVPAGAEIPAEDRGFELTCSGCPTVILRSIPGEAQPAISREGYAIKIEISGIQPVEAGLAIGRGSASTHVCAECAAIMLEPFADVLAATGFSVDLIGAGGQRAADRDEADSMRAAAQTEADAEPAAATLGLEPRA